MARGKQADTVEQKAPAKAQRPKRTRAPKAPPPEGEQPPEPPADPRRPATRVRAGSLRAALRDVGGAVETKSTIPILTHVLFAARDGRIELVATNLDLWAERSLATHDREPGSAEWQQSIRGFCVALPEKPLAAILGEIDADATVTIEHEPAEGGAGRVAISAGRARFRLACLPADDFVMPSGFAAAASMDLRCAELADAFARVEFAISTEETRYYLNGVYLHPQQGEGEPIDLRFAATDGHRLARLRIDLPDGGASFPPTIVAMATVSLLDKLCVSAVKATPEGAEAPRVVVEHDGGGLLRFDLPAADGGDITVTAKAIDGTFPEYSRVIPTSTPHSVIVSRAALAEAAKRVGALASDRTRALRLQLAPDRIELVVTTPEVGEAREEVASTYDGPECAIGFNGVFLREALAALASDEVSLAFDVDGPGSVAGPVLVRAAGDGVDRDKLVQVLMPMRV